LVESWRNREENVTVRTNHSKGRGKLAGSSGDVCITLEKKKGLEKEIRTCPLNTSFQGSQPNKLIWG